MNPNFQPDRENRRADLVDPEAYDASEQQFAASLDVPVSEESERSLSIDTGANSAGEASPLNNDASASNPSEDSTINETQTSWRKEVSERVSKYRRRSPREPRYPSLQLKFESSQPSWSAPPRNVPATTRQSVALESDINFEANLSEGSRLESASAAIADAEVIDNLIEFPRFAVEPTRLDELAGPVQDQLRIIEAPDVTPTPPALGGILIEPLEENAQERRPGFEIPLQSASLARRFAAAAVDSVIVLAAVSLFGVIFLHLTSSTLPLFRLAALGTILSGLFWVAYQYLFLVHTGSTPGLRIARLCLSRFDGTGVRRSTRRWRVVTSVLSGISLGLGYVWCFLDEDQLCWHDRITRTHLAPKHSFVKS
jgi:uncharacterized RDD family membrane protein YckC